jgi:hypothetical protein
MAKPIFEGLIVHMTTPVAVFKSRRLSVALILSMVAASAFAAERTSNKKWPPIALANHFSCYGSKHDLNLACGFLLKYNNKVFAVSVKHVLPALKVKGVEGLNHLSLEGVIKEWSMFSKEIPSEKVTLDKFLNEDRNAKLASLDLYIDDWVVFTIKKNDAHVKPLEIRKAPLKPGERLYVVGWTNAQLDGPQRTYQYAYYKTIGTRILLKELIVPAKIGGLSGAPVIDENGLLVGLISSGVVDPVTGKKYFSACAVTNLAAFLDKYQSKK